MSINSNKQRIALFGSGGSIGRQAIDAIAAHPQRLELFAITTGSNLELLAEQVREHKPRFYDCGAAHTPGRIGAAERLEQESIARRDEVDTVVFANAGFDSLAVLLAALRGGKRVALANKELLVMAGETVMAAARSGGGQLVPVDSEPSAIHQCLAGEPDPPRRLILTASGGPLRGRTAAETARATPEEVLRHPTWSMGPKIPVDSATLVN